MNNSPRITAALLAAAAAATVGISLAPAGPAAADTGTSNATTTQQLQQAKRPQLPPVIRVIVRDIDRLLGLGDRKLSDGGGGKSRAN